MAVVTAPPSWFRSPEVSVVDLDSLTKTEFVRHDPLGSGFLDAAQFRRALGQIAFRLKPDRMLTGPWFDALFAELDSDCDGRLNFADFQAAVGDLHDFEFRRSSDEWRSYAEGRKREMAASEKAAQVTQLWAGGQTLPPPLMTGGLFGSYEAVGSGVGSFLGEGAFGKVLRVKHRRTGEEFACKSVPIDTEQAAELVQSEVSLLTQLDHVNMLQLYEVFFEGSAVHLVTELCSGGSLGDRLDYHRGSLGRPMPEGQAALYLEQLLSAAGYCHERGVVHRDLKPDNALFVGRAVDSPLKVIDFGLAETLDRLQQRRRAELAPREGTLGAVARMLPRLPDGSELISTQVSRSAMQRAGTPHYMAPEVYSGEYGPKADIFSIGCMAVEMLGGRHPFYAPGDDLEAIRRKICHEHIDIGTPLHEAGVTAQAARLCGKMLRHQPDQRTSAREALADVWFGGFSRLATEGALTLTAAEVRSAVTRFASGGPLRQLVLRALVRELGEAQVQGLRQAFLHLDLDGDGVLSAVDLLAVIDQGAHAGRSSEQVRAEAHAFIEAVSQVGTASADACAPGAARGAGALGYSDFLAALLPRRVTLRPEQLAQAFERLDVSFVGQLTSAGLQQAVLSNLGGYGAAIPPDLLRAANAEIDSCHGGGIDLPCFCRLAQVAAASDGAFDGSFQQ